jgi:hypothetical protein
MLACLDLPSARTFVQPSFSPRLELEMLNGVRHVRVFLLIRHRDDVVVAEVAPSRVAAGGRQGAPPEARKSGRGHRSYRIADSSGFPPTPAASTSLLRRSSLPVEAPRKIRRLRGFGQLEFVRRPHRNRSFCWGVADQPKSDLGSLSDSDSDVVPAGHLRPASFGIDSRRSIDDVVVDSILRIEG